MSEKKIRILPVQAEKLTVDNNLLDIDIPANLLINPVKSYISLFMKIIPVENDTAQHLPANSGGTGVYNLDAVINVENPSVNAPGAGYNVNVKVPTVAIVRNANMISANKGMVENLRDVNALRLSQYSVERNYEERTGDAHYSFGSLTTQPWGYMSPFIDKGNKDFGVSAQNLLKEVRIPLKDIFNICKREDLPLDTSYLGKTRIHLELDIRRLFVDSAYKEQNGTPMININNPLGYGRCNNDNTPGPVTSLTLARTFLNANAESEVPFYLGQRIILNTGSLDGADISGRIRKIVGMGFGGNSMTLQLDESLGTIAAAGTANMAIMPHDPQTATVEIQRSELVICESNASPMNGYRYSTYSLEKDNGGGSASFNRQYEVEPEAISLLVHTSTKPQGLLSDVRPDKTRVSIDNEQTTNRDVGRHGPLYNNRLIRYYLNDGKPPHSLAQGKSRRDRPNDGQTDATLPNTEAWIYEPLETTGQMKLVELDIEAGAHGRVVNDIKLYKEVIREI